MPIAGEPKNLFEKSKLFDLQTKSGKSPDFNMFYSKIMFAIQYQLDGLVWGFIKFI